MTIYIVAFTFGVFGGLLWMIAKLKDRKLAAAAAIGMTFYTFMAAALLSRAWLHPSPHAALDPPEALSEYLFFWTLALPFGWSLCAAGAMGVCMFIYRKKGAA